MRSKCQAEVLPFEKLCCALTLIRQQNERLTLCSVAARNAASPRSELHDHRRCLIRQPSAQQQLARPTLIGARILCSEPVLYNVRIRDPRPTVPRKHPAFRLLARPAAAPEAAPPSSHASTLVVRTAASRRASRTVLRRRRIAEGACRRSAILVGRAAARRADPDSQGAITPPSPTRTSPAAPRPR